MIEFFHVYKTYSGNVQALKNINLKIDKGEFVFLTGHSGAGKTTLFKVMSAYSKPSSGSINVAGYDLNKIKSSEIPYYRRRIGVVYQDFKLLRDRNILENVGLPLEIRDLKRDYIKAKTNEILESVGLFHKRNHYPQQLSGGEQQRVAIARALVHQPKVLVADEPTGNLDPYLSEEIMDLLDKVNAQGTTVFCATHDHELVKRRAKRTINLDSGVLTE